MFQCKIVEFTLICLVAGDPQVTALQFIQFHDLSHQISESDLKAIKVDHIVCKFTERRIKNTQHVAF